MAARADSRGRRLPRLPMARPSFDGSLGDGVLYGVCVLAGIVAAAILGEIAFQVITGAQPSISQFGLPFIGHSVWAPNFARFGAGTMLFGTVVSAAIALIIAAPLAIAIAIYLSMLAP